MNTRLCPTAMGLFALLFAALAYGQSGGTVSVPNTTGPSAVIQGHGAASLGGAGGPIYRVTTLADSGAGSLRDGVINRSGPRTIIFAVGDTITLLSDLRVRQPYLTIDGSTAPPPGITIRMANVNDGEFMIEGTHDIVLRHLRFYGTYQGGEVTVESDILGIDGDSSPDNHAHHIVFDHLALRSSTDGAPDFYGTISDVTVSWCLIYYCFHPTNASYDPDPSLQRRRISMHHNVYARNGERNPQFKAGTTEFDFVNNVIFDYGYFGGWGYGTRLRNVVGATRSSGNLINNYYAPTRYQNLALVYGTDPGRDGEDAGPSTSPPQGTVVTNTQMGSLYVAGNVLPSQNLDQYSTVNAPIAVPATARVTAHAATDLKVHVLPLVGPVQRTAEEQTILTAAAAAMTGPARLPADLDGDRDVDMDDMNRLKACSTRDRVRQLNATCLAADLDGDLDVDQRDFAQMQRCTTGSNWPMFDSACLRP